MKPEFILMIIAGSIFVVMLLICCIVEFRRSNMHVREREQVKKSYEGENLKKMEYDVAFYDKKEFKLNFNSVGDEQVTIDELLSEDKERAEKSAQRAVFTQLEEDGVDVIKGAYRPAD